MGVTLPFTTGRIHEIDFNHEIHEIHEIGLTRIRFVLFVGFVVIRDQWM